MCDYCDCRSEPEIAELSAEHEALLELTRALRRTPADDPAAPDLLGRLAAILLPHAAREEAGIFAALRAAGVHDAYVAGLEAEHVRIDDLLAGASGDPASMLALVDLLEDHILREETDAYPAAHQMLGPTEWQAVARATGRTPAPVGV